MTRRAPFETQESRRPSDRRRTETREAAVPPPVATSKESSFFSVSSYGSCPVAALREELEHAPRDVSLRRARCVFGKRDASRIDRPPDPPTLYRCQAGHRAHGDHRRRWVGWT